MIATIRMNWIIGLVAFVFTFALSISNNLLMTTLLSSTYAFIILFVLTFVFRWVLGRFAGLNPSVDGAIGQISDESSVGQNLDLSTPADDEGTKQLLASQMNGNDAYSEASDLAFSPLSPPKLATKNNLNPEQLAGALRRMSED